MPNVYDVKKTTTVVDGAFLTGLGADSPVTAEMAEERVIPFDAVDGGVAYSINANSRGTVTIKLNSTSPSIKFLNNLAKAKKSFAISHTDQNVNGINFTGLDAYVMNPVFPEKGKEVSEVEFSISVGELTID